MPHKDASPDPNRWIVVGPNHQELSVALGAAGLKFLIEPARSRTRPTEAEGIARRRELNQSDLRERREASPGISIYDDIVDFGKTMVPPNNRPGNYWRHLINVSSKYYYLGPHRATVDRGRHMIDKTTRRSSSAAKEEEEKLERLRQLGLDVYEFPAAETYAGGYHFQGAHELYVSYFHTVRGNPIQLFRRTPNGIGLTSMMGNWSRADAPQSQKEEEARSYELIDAGLTEVHDALGTLRAIARPATAQFFEAYLDRA